MNARVSLGAGCLMLAVAGWCAGGDDAKDMEGTWIPVTAELAGTKFPDDMLKTMRLVLGNGRYLVKVGDVADQGTIKLDPDKKPKAMDIIGTDGPNKGKTFPAIYELNGDMLRICYDLSGQARPTEFKSPKDSHHFLVNYKREKR